MPISHRRRRPRVVIRPQTWEEFVGHTKIVKTLRQAKEAARRRQELMRPVLLWGPPGCGKTSLVRLLAGKEDSLLQVSGSSIEPLELVNSLLKLKRGGFVLIDEAHSLSGYAQEILYPIIDEGLVHWAGEVRKVAVSVAATTTELGKLARPFRDRFSLILYVPSYPEPELATIAEQMATKLGLVPTPGGPEAVAAISRGTPRWVLKLVEQVLDTSVELSKAAVADAAESLGFDRDGLLTEERVYLAMLALLRGRSSISNISAAMGQGVQSTREIESFLVKSGYISISSRGREPGIRGIEYLQRMGIDVFSPREAK